MLAEWSAECSPDDPTVVVPWYSPEGHVAFVDLRSNPYDLADIQEAEQFPALGRALRALNAARSPFFTAKCDVWPLSATEQSEALRSLQIELDLEHDDSAAGLGTYIDLLWRERTVFGSAHQQIDRLERLVRRAEKLPHVETSVQFVLRPALLDFNTPLEGFATTLYVTSLGPDAHTAKARWEAALESVVHLLRSRGLEPPTGSATIES